MSSDVNIFLKDSFKEHKKGLSVQTLTPFLHVVLLSILKMVYVIFSFLRNSTYPSYRPHLRLILWRPRMSSNPSSIIKETTTATYIYRNKNSDNICSLYTSCFAGFHPFLSNGIFTYKFNFNTTSSICSWVIPIYLSVSAWLEWFNNFWIIAKSMPCL